MIAIIYTMGMVLSYGLYTGAMYKLEKDDIDDRAPSYDTAHDDKTAYMFALLSWIGVFTIIVLMIYYKRVPIIKYSYKKLWDLYNSKNQK